MVVVRWMVMSRAVCANFDFGPVCRTDTNRFSLNR